MRKLLPIILALVGTGAGVGAGLMLTPAEQEHADAVECLPPAEHAKAEPVKEEDLGPEEGMVFVKLNNQFVVPVVGPERVQSLVVLSLTIEARTGTTERVYALEPKLRDVFLQVMFDHANIGGFAGAFTSGPRMDVLRRALLEAARNVMGRDVANVLITEVARQDA
ncbi:MAG: flagellar basal body-associated FliL family protein [Paracoccaceae bacterium]|nr:flagellar basal body-associated FliL family protein [Paracoccaceae bacterium]